MPQEVDHATGQHVGQVVARLALFEVRHIPDGRCVRLASKRKVVVAGCPARFTPSARSKPCRVGWSCIGLPQMPLTEVGRLVSGIPKGLTQCSLVRRQRDARRRMNPVGDSHPLRCFAGHQGRSCGRADGVAGIEIRQPHALPRKRVQRRRLVERRAIHPQVAASQIVGQESRAHSGVEPPHDSWRDQHNSAGTSR